VGAAEAEEGAAGGGTGDGVLRAGTGGGGGEKKNCGAHSLEGGMEGGRENLEGYAK
jgi:hypothetical protein